MRKLWFILPVLLVLTSCGQKEVKTEQPVSSSHEVTIRPDGSIAMEEEAGAAEEAAKEAAEEIAEEAEATDAVPAPDFTLTDQYGETHTLSDYKGRVVFLNFWATWCPPCRAEMPDIQALYEEEATKGEDGVVILGVAGPRIYGNEGTAEDVAAFLSENGYTYPVVMDTDGSLMQAYGISAFPTTFMINSKGEVQGYLTGSMTREIMDSIIEQTR